MAKRKVLHVPGVKHKAPIPTAVKIGNMVYSSAVMGYDPATGKLPEDIRTEVAHVFRHIRTIMELAEGSAADIAHFSVLLSSNDYRSMVNEEWLALFPDEEDRPARHITIAELQGGMHIQIEIIAVL